MTQLPLYLICNYEHNVPRGAEYWPESALPKLGLRPRRLHPLTTSGIEFVGDDGECRTCRACIEEGQRMLFLYNRE